MAARGDAHRTRPAGAKPAKRFFCVARRGLGIVARKQRVPAWRKRQHRQMRIAAGSAAAQPERIRGPGLARCRSRRVRTRGLSRSDPHLALGGDRGTGSRALHAARKTQRRPSGGVLTLKSEPGAAVFLQHESRSPVRANQYLSRTRCGRPAAICARRNRRKASPGAASPHCGRSAGSRPGPRISKAPSGSKKRSLTLPASRRRPMSSRAD